MKFVLRMIAALLFASALAGPAALATPVPGYLFVTFKGEQLPTTEQIYFAVSVDGRTWSALNGAAPVLSSAVGEKGVRDPYLIRAHHGQGFFLIATDLSIYWHPDWKRAVRGGSRSIVIWESPDLVSWSEPRLVEVAPEDAGCTWAPEAVYDEEKGDYLVFWASTTARNDYAKHAIWAARTKDFREFSAPFLYIEKPTTIIDATIVREGHTYYRFIKDEKHKAITMEKAERLSGPWSELPEFSLAKLVGYEGPQCYLLQPGSAGEPPTWALILDNYQRKRGYRPFVSRDLASGKFEEAADFVFTYPFRHGSVMPLPAAELARLQAAYGLVGDIKNVSDASSR